MSHYYESRRRNRDRRERGGQDGRPRDHDRHYPSVAESSSYSDRRGNSFGPVQEAAGVGFPPPLMQTGNMRQPARLQQQAGIFQPPAANFQQPGNFQQGGVNFQQPGSFQQPSSFQQTNNFQQPGNFTQSGRNFTKPDPRPVSPPRNERRSSGGNYGGNSAVGVGASGLMGGYSGAGRVGEASRGFKGRESGDREIIDDLRPVSIEEDRDSTPPPAESQQLLQDFQQLLDKLIDTQPAASKQVIYLRPCILYPPPPGAAPVTVRDRPPGCKTVFVGGLPVCCTRDILLEVFESCRVSNIRHTGNHAYVKFYNEADVEKAVQISGYRMKIRSRDEDNPENSGILHVDYYRDDKDLKEWEEQQRSLMDMHNSGSRGDGNDAMSPAELAVYMSPEQLQDKIKSPEYFGVGLDVLVLWLEQGKCNQKTYTTYFNLLQSVHSQVKVVGVERDESKREYLTARQRYRVRHKAIMQQFEQIDRVFSYATKQKVWDNFSKPQRRMLESWRKECADLRAALEAESLRDQWADEEDAGMSGTKKRRQESVDEKLREDNETLRCQLEAYRNEVDLLKVELREQKPESQLDMLQQAVKNMQEQLLKSTGQIQTESIHMLQSRMKREPGGFSDFDARCIALSACFLSLLPEGASVDYVLTYLQHAGLKISSSELASVLDRCPSVFRRETGSIENRFRYVAFGQQN